MLLQEGWPSCWSILWPVESWQAGDSMVIVIHQYTRSLYKICMHAHTHTNTHAHTCTHTQLLTHTHTYTCTNTYTYTTLCARTQAERDALQVAAMNRGAAGAAAGGGGGARITGTSPLRGGLEIRNAGGRASHVGSSTGLLGGVDGGGYPGGGGGGEGPASAAAMGSPPKRISGVNPSVLHPPLQQQMQQMQLQQQQQQQQQQHLDAATLARMDPKARKEVKRQQEIQQREAELLQVCACLGMCACVCVGGGGGWGVRVCELYVRM